MPKVTIVENILVANDTTAEAIHQRLAARGIRALNMMSSPGAGKTTLLERTIERLRGRLTLGVIEGDIETTADAERIERAGAEAVQINTRGACHLEAHMVGAALDQLDLSALELVVIENVGNLVCPAAWNLGEDARVVLVSTTEGDDKPAKYPQMFAVADALVVNKLDLLPYVDYDVATVRAHALAVNPRLRVFELSCRTGEGLDAWCDWLCDWTRGDRKMESGA
ncbi:MAG TPA: hydrogenase nickel incorporation protein HypB [Ktedonobacterales bacterium]|nr:hydrogenase nickel incorporation protein HypB [Ktedonobacterales bacterium]